MEKQKNIIGFIRVILNVMWYLGAIAGVIVIIAFIIVGMSVDVPPGQKINITYQTFSRSVLDISMKAADTKNTKMKISPGAISFGVDKNFFVKSKFFMVPMLILFLTIVYLLRGIFNDLHAKKSPFIKKNCLRVRWVGICIIIGAFVLAFLDFVVGKYIVENIEVANINFYYGFNLRFDMIFLGLIILVLSEIFRYGHQLQQEQELTI